MLPQRSYLLAQSVGALDPLDPLVVEVAKASWCRRVLLDPRPSRLCLVLETRWWRPTRSPLTPAATALPAETGVVTNAFTPV